MTDYYRLPAHATPLLSRASGVPWQDAQRIDGHHFIGLVRNSIQWFPGASPALFFESDFDVCQDGREMRVKGDTFIGDNALHEADGRAFNAFQFPYGVLPLTVKQTAAGHKRKVSVFKQDFNLDLGDLGICFWRGRAVPFLFGDLGPADKIGEGSCFLAEQLGINADPVRGGYHKVDAGAWGDPRGKRGIVWLAFPGSRRVVKGRTQHTLTTLGVDAWDLYTKFTDARAR